MVSHWYDIRVAPFHVQNHPRISFLIFLQKLCEKIRDGSVHTTLVYTYLFVFPLERYFMVCLELLNLLVCPVQVRLQLCVLESGKKAENEVLSL